MGPRSLITPKDDQKGGIFTQQDSSIGYLVITPFQMEDREYVVIKHSLDVTYNLFYSNIILINRGWVPKNSVNPNNRLEGQIQGTIEFVGVVRKSENRPQFTPKQSGEIFMYRLVKKFQSG